MKIIFGTTSERKMEDINNVVHKLHANMEVLSLNDIGWDRGEINETGSTLEENSLIKAKAILSFCKDHSINCPIVSDDSGLFIDALNGEPGVQTSRYADEELRDNPNLPKHQCVIKIIEKMKGKKDRHAEYRSCVTVIMPDGHYYQEKDKSDGAIAETTPKVIDKPFCYSIFILNGTDTPFAQLKGKRLHDTFRYKTLQKSLQKLLQENSTHALKQS